MNVSLDFKKSTHLSIGVELELQLINLHHFDLAMEAEDYLRRLAEISQLNGVKPEITQSMIEINSSIHNSYSTLLQELNNMQQLMTKEARKTHIGICGGGTHPFQKWKQRRIFQSERFASLSEQYGYLAKQFTVFGQHIHIGCASGDDAIYLCHAMARFLPQFIALSASSPFNQGIDTAFDCSRLAVISAFPLSGTPPWLHHWAEFETYCAKLLQLGIIKSVKDFYWDIRPKPEFGTVELRICDTPLTMKQAAILAAYLRILAHYLLETRSPLSRDIYLVYLINRFRASRYGYEATIIDPTSQQHILLADDILRTCDLLKPHAKALNCLEVLDLVRENTLQRKNGAAWLRSRYTKLASLTDTVRTQTQLWMGELE